MFTWVKSDIWILALGQHEKMKIITLSLVQSYMFINFHIKATNFLCFTFSRIYITSFQVCASLVTVTVLTFSLVQVNFDIFAWVKQGIWTHHLIKVENCKFEHFHADKIKILTFLLDHSHIVTKFHVSV